MPSQPRHLLVVREGTASRRPWWTVGTSIRGCQHQARDDLRVRVTAVLTHHEQGLFRESRRSSITTHGLKRLFARSTTAMCTGKPERALASNDIYSWHLRSERGRRGHHLSTTPRTSQTASWVQWLECYQKPPVQHPRQEQGAASEAPGAPTRAPKGDRPFASAAAL